MSLPKNLSQVRNKYHQPSLYAHSTPTYSDEVIEKIEAAIPQSILEALSKEGFNVFGIFSICLHYLEEEQKEAKRNASKSKQELLYQELDVLINSIPNKKQSAFLPDLKLHKKEFLTILARDLDKKSVTLEQIKTEFNRFWHEEYSLMDILCGLGYSDRECLLKFIGVQNDGMIQITREQKDIRKLLEWKSEGKIEKLQDIEDCYFWCQQLFVNAGKSYSIVIKWFSKFIEQATRKNDRLVATVKSFEKKYENAEDFLQ